MEHCTNLTRTGRAHQNAGQPTFWPCLGHHSCSCRSQQEPRSLYGSFRAAPAAKYQQRAELVPCKTSLSLQFAFWSIYPTFLPFWRRITIDWRNSQQLVLRHWQRKILHGRTHHQRTLSSDRCWSWRYAWLENRHRSQALRSGDSRHLEMTQR